MFFNHHKVLFLWRRRLSGRPSIAVCIGLRGLLFVFIILGGGRCRDATFSLGLSRYCYSSLCLFIPLLLRLLLIIIIIIIIIAILLLKSLAFLIILLLLLLLHLHHCQRREVVTKARDLNHFGSRRDYSHLLIRCCDDIFGSSSG